MPRTNAEFILCMACLGVEKFTDEKHEGNVNCHCGGEFCGCSGCEDEAIEIYQVLEQAEFIDASKY